MDLCARAGGKERGKYYCGFTDGTYIWGDSSTYTMATSSAMGRPCALPFVKTIDGPNVRYDYVNYSKPITYPAADLRLNIYAASWGSSDVSDTISIFSVPCSVILK